jgi:hypothetical protein
MQKSQISKSDSSANIDLSRFVKSKVGTVKFIKMKSIRYPKSIMDKCPARLRVVLLLEMVQTPRTPFYDSQQCVTVYTMLDTRASI